MEQPPGELQAVANDGPYNEAKRGEAAEGGGGGFRTIELGSGGAPAGGAAPEVEGHEAPSLRSFRSGSRKARRLEWNVQDYTIKLRRKRTLTILHNIGAL